MTDAPTDDQLAIGRAFEDVVAWLRRSRSTGDISATGLSVLDRLDATGPQRVTDLAVLEGISQPATTSIVNRLEDRGWARRYADPTDGRAARVALTDAGRERLLRHRSDRSRRIAQRLATLDAADQAALIAALPALVHLTSAAPAPRVPPPPVHETQHG